MMDRRNLLKATTASVTGLYVGCERHFHDEAEDAARKPEVFDCACSSTRVHAQLSHCPAVAG